MKTIKRLLPVMLIFVVSVCLAIVTACGSKKYTVSFDSDGGSAVASQTIESGSKATKPEDPTKTDYEFDGWYLGDTEYDFDSKVTSSITLKAHWKLPPIEEIEYNGQKITLSDKALYVDASLEESQLGSYAFNTLEACVAAAQSGTKGNATVIYLAPDVYWTDDPDDPATRDADHLIGLTVPQEYITMIGLADDYRDVVICSNRGQTQGANGNYNTIAVANGFHAENITFGNYCNVDLVYPKDTTKNREKRSASIVQAQTVTSTTWDNTADEHYYVNCAFVSRLNCYVANAKRELYVDCHFEMTDDALGSGLIQIYQNCDFDLYSGTPNTVSSYLQAFLGCTFNSYLTGTDKIIAFSKGIPNCAFIDCNFEGEIDEVNWCKSVPVEYVRNVVYNTKINGEALAIDSSLYPNCQYTLTDEQIKTFKVGNEYNVYNLLNNAGDLSEWDPLNQKAAMASSLLPWGVMLSANKSNILGDGEDGVTVSANVLGLATGVTLNWVADSNIATITKNADGSVTVKATNSDYQKHHICLTCTTNTGIKKAIYFDVAAKNDVAPTVSGVSITNIDNGKVYLTYTLSANLAANVGQEELNPDQTVVEWYRSNSATLDSSAIKVATTRYFDGLNVTPYVEYELSKGDIGYYLLAVVTPAYKYSDKGTPSEAVATSAVITADDLTEAQNKTYYTDFSNVVAVTPNMTVVNGTDEKQEDKFKNTTWSGLESGFWYAGVQKPVEYNADGVQAWAEKTFTILDGDGNPLANPWTYTTGQDGMKDKYGMLTTQRGARLVYVDDTEVTDMSMTTVLGIEKTASQGFGSGYQFLEVYFKYDEATHTGYGLRISRCGTNNGEKELYGQFSDFFSSAVLFQLMEYKNGVATELAHSFSSAYLSDCTVEFTMVGNKLTCNVSTTREQDSVKYEALTGGMPHNITLEATVQAANSYSGFGYQFTGTVSGGNRTAIQSVEVTYGAKD